MLRRSVACLEKQTDELEANRYSPRRHRCRRETRRQKRRQEKSREPRTQLMGILRSHEVDETQWGQNSRRAPVDTT